MDASNAQHLVINVPFILESLLGLGMLYLIWCFIKEAFWAILGIGVLIVGVTYFGGTIFALVDYLLRGLSTLAHTR